MGQNYAQMLNTREKRNGEGASNARYGTEGGCLDPPYPPGPPGRIDFVQPA